VQLSVAHVAVANNLELCD